MDEKAQSRMGHSKRWFETLNKATEALLNLRYNRGKTDKVEIVYVF